MTTYEVWAEGFRATGNQDQAYYWGQAEGETFTEACQQLARINPAFAEYFDAERLTHWGCRLFPTEAEARQTYG